MSNIQALVKLKDVVVELYMDESGSEPEGKEAVELREFPSYRANWERVNRLREALEKSVQVIKQWHQADDVWEIYYNHAPEMKFIRETLSAS